MITHGLLVRLEAAPGKDADVEALLRGLVALLRDEPGTTAWYAVKFGRSEYGMFDAFHGEADRQEHLHGSVVQSLMESESLLLAPPTIEKIRVLASKLPSTPAEAAQKGLMLTFPAKLGRAEQVEQFLRDAELLVKDEPKTTAWFAIQRENGYYGIFDVFPDSGGRFSHLTGHVPRELAKHALSMLGGLPDVSMVDVVAEQPLA